MRVINEAKDELKLMIVLFKTYQNFINFIKDDIKDTDFDLNEFAVLEIIYHKRNLTVAEIKDKLLLANSSLTYILDKLVKKGLVERQRCKDDKRVIYISLTEKGLNIANEVFPNHYDNLKEVFKILTKEERDKTIEILKKLSFNINK